VKILATTLAYFLALAVVASVAFVVVMFLAGPHSGLLPFWLEGVVGAAGWLAVLVLPVLLARKVWRSFARNERDAIAP
jgi:hypothetical protein